jgi:RES domain-containing protein
MATYWRISNYPDLSGEGGRVASARWHTAGRRIVYMTESPTSAILETLVHFDGDIEDIPDFYNLLQISIPDDAAIQRLDPPPGSKWREDQTITRDLGDIWLASSKTALARVPSAIAPHTWNYLLNPAHPDASRASFSHEREQFDSRLFGFGSR